METIQKKRSGSNGVRLESPEEFIPEAKPKGTLIAVPSTQHLLGEVNRSTQAFLTEANSTTQAILHEVTQLMRDCGGDIRLSETYTNLIEPDGTRKMIVQRVFNLSKDPPV